MSAFTVQINVVIKKLSKMTHIHSVNCDVHKIFWVEVEFLKNMKKLLFPNGKSGIALWLYHEFGFLLWFSDWVITFYMIMHFLRELCSNNQRTENIWSTKNSSNWIVFLLIQTNEHYNYWEFYQICKTLIHKRFLWISRF